MRHERSQAPSLPGAAADHGARVRAGRADQRDPQIASEMEFSTNEFHARLAHLHQLMREERFEATLIVDEYNYRYITGHHTEAWKNHSRRRACWVHVDHEPVLIVPPGEALAARQCSPWSDVVEYNGLTAASDGIVVRGDPLLSFEPGLTDALLSTARRLGIRHTTAPGIALGGWAKLEVPLGVIGALQERIGFPRWRDAASLLWALRTVKSEAEIDYMRLAVHALDDAYQRTFREVETGISEQELARIMRANILRGGAEHPAYTIVASDVRRPRAIGATPGATTVEEGAVALIDAGAVVHGYTSDYSRMFSVGEPSPTQKAAYAAVVEAQRRGLELIKPGVKVRDVARAMNVVLTNHGAAVSPVGRTGHGAGLEVPEPPSFHLAADAVFVEGMIVCVEPNMTLPADGTFVVEDVVVVREHGIEHLSSSPTPTQLSRC